MGQSEGEMEREQQRETEMASSSSKRSGDVFDLGRLTQIIELMKEHGLTEVDLQQDKQKIRLARGGMVPASAAAATLPGVAAAAPAIAAAHEDTSHIVTIKSPMVGTYYSKPNPEAANFVKVGDAIGTDTIVCIIEAMKVFNEIPADVSGQIVAVLLENEESVEFGKPLFKVDTSK